MTDEELRAIIRQAVQRHVGAGASPLDPPKLATVLASEGGPQRLQSISFGQYSLERAADDTMCIIEPAVSCNHCGFCKCHGH
jgi:hypothetical protein